MQYVIHEGGIHCNVLSIVQLFNSPPTSGLAGFMAKEVSEEDMNLFGGLTHSISTDLNEPLGLPHLPSDHNDVTLLPKVTSTCVLVLTVTMVTL